MIPKLSITIKANPILRTRAAVRHYIDELCVDHPILGLFKNALVDIVNTREDDKIDIYWEPDMDGDFVSTTNGTLILWMHDIGRAACTANQSGDWQWTDASSPEDALHRYQNDEMAN